MPSMQTKRLRDVTVSSIRLSLARLDYEFEIESDGLFVLKGYW